MTRSRIINAVCVAVAALMLAAALLVTLVQANAEAAPITMPYAQKLFSTDRVHTLDIIADESDWQSLLDNAANKEYIACTLVVDGEAFANVAIRTKGNSTLSTMVNSDSDRYSFKVEFDHYDPGKTYYGLDKLALNNLAQDATLMKDYVSYQLMNKNGADAPLSSYVYITLNGEDWGLYLAVEGIEEAFAQRNYGSDYGQIYKPETMDMNMGGDRQGGGFPEMPQGMPDMSNMPRGQDGEMPDTANMPWEQDGEMPDLSQLPDEWAQQGGRRRQREGGELSGGFGGMGGGMGRSTSDVALIYTDDNHDSYSNIFDSAIFDITDSDKDRLIASLKQMNAGENLDDVVNVDEVLRYFAAHNFLLNFDSYTGSMNHNYYLYEKDGKLSMIAWDYNLAFGSFAMGGMGGMGGGGSASSTTSLVNFPIDTPTSGSQLTDRPMLNVFLSNEEYLAQYHAVFQELISEAFDSGWFGALIDEAAALISPYAEKDPSGFFTHDEFETGVATLREFGLLRAQSIQGQLDGSIPATSDGQAADSSALVDASHINYQAMGSTGGGMGGMGFGGGARNNAQQMTPPEGFMESGTQASGQGGGSVPWNQILPIAASIAVLGFGLLFVRRYGKSR